MKKEGFNNNIENFDREPFSQKGLNHRSTPTDREDLS